MDANPNGFSNSIVVFSLVCSANTAPQDRNSKRFGNAARRALDDGMLFALTQVTPRTG